MSGIEIKDEDMKRLFSEAILAHISATGRDTLIKEAIRYLLTEQERQGPNYSKIKFTPLSEAFSNAVACEARQIIKEHIEQDPQIKEAIATVVQAAVLKMLADPTLVESITTMITQLFAKAAEQTWR